MRPIKIATALGSTFKSAFELRDFDGQPIDLTALGATRVVVSVCDPSCSAEISSDTDDVTFGGDVIEVRFGSLMLKARGLPYFPKISYSVPDGDNEVIVGQGFPASVELTVRC